MPELITTLGPNDSVRLVNQGDKPWKDMYDGVRYAIPVGGETFVPFPAACLWFGHPDSIDVDDKNRHRTDEMTRLRVKYGLYENDVDPRTGEDLWAKNVPQIAVVSLSGQRVVTVLDDPTGSNITPTQQTVAAQSQVTDMLAGMQAQIDALTRQLAREQQAGQATMDSDAEDDAPFVPPIGEPALVLPPGAVPPLVGPSVGSSVGPSVDTPSAAVPPLPGSDEPAVRPDQAIPRPPTRIRGGSKPRVSTKDTSVDPEPSGTPGSDVTVDGSDQVRVNA